MLTWTQDSEPREPIHRRWAAAVRAKPRPLQAAIFSAVAAVIAGLIAVVLIVAAPGGEPLASELPLPDHVVPPPQKMVPPPPASKLEARPSDLVATGAETEQEPSVADRQEADQAGAAGEPRPHDDLLQTLIEDGEENYGVGGRSLSSEETFEGTGEFVPAPPNQARAAIRAYIGASPLEQLPMSFTYLVQPDETMAGIAQRFGLHLSSVRINNMHIDDPAQMQVGTELELPVRDGLIYKVQSGDTLEDLVYRYEADRDATIAYGPNRLTPDPNAIYINQQLLLVGGTRPDLKGEYFAPLTAPVIWYMPVEYERITDPFGTPRNNHYGIHTGVDFAAPTGAPVRAARAGTVSNGGWDDSYGRWIEIDHGGEIKSRYAHLSGSRVVIGQHVAAWEVIGWIGSTGRSTGPHLHFEILRDNQPINPHPALGLS